MQDGLVAEDAPGGPEASTAQFLLWTCPRRVNPSLRSRGCRPPSCSDAGRSLSTPTHPSPSLPFFLPGQSSPPRALLTSPCLAGANFNCKKWTRSVEYWHSSSSLLSLFYAAAQDTLSTGGSGPTYVSPVSLLAFPLPQRSPCCSSSRRHSENATRAVCKSSPSTTPPPTSASLRTT